MTEPKLITVTQVRSQIGCTERQRKTLLGLGLRHIGTSAVVRENAPTLGMIRKVAHLVQVRK